MKQALLFIFLFSALIFISPGLSLAGTKPAGKNSVSFRHAPPSNQLYTPWVDSVFRSLTPDERITQLMMVAAYSNRDEQHVSQIAVLIDSFRVGGLIFFQGGPVRQAQMTNYFQSVSKTPLMIAIDGEWGLGMRLDSTLSFPRQMMLGAMDRQNDSLVYKMGKEIATELKALGVQVNFAPVVDINNNPENPVINNRSFGENKNLVARKGLLYMNGMQDEGILAVAKHFPGHGDTDTDSHLTLPVVKFGYQRLDTLELFPFRRLIDAGTGGLMIAHLFVPALDSSKNMASTLSRKITTGIVRDSLKFKGLVFTDALSMKGVSEFFQPGDLEARALEAGNDVLLMPSDIPKALAAIKMAILNGQLRQSQVDSSCRRVLAAKEWAGLNHYRPVNVSTLKKDIDTPRARLLQQEITESAITILKNDHILIPLQRLDTLRTALVLAGTDTSNVFSETLQLYNNIDVYYLPGGEDSLQIDSLIYSLRHYNLVIASTHHTDYRPTKNFGIDSSTIKFLDRLSANKPVILDLFATPYALNFFSHPENFASIIVSYQDTPVAQDISAQVIYGAIGVSGKLPVSTNVFPVNTRQFSPGGLRLKYTMPEKLGINSSKLAEIDSIVLDAIRQKAIPGCQVLAAKDGKVFYYKAFGYQTYDTLYPVKKDDLYDLASVTKIAATTPAIMRLYEENKIKLKNKLPVYLHELKRTNKRDITLLDVMTHQARLQPYIPFYLQTLQPVHPGEKLFSPVASEKYPYPVSAKQFVNKSVTFRENLITTRPDVEHGIQVADHMFLVNSYTDTMFREINESKLLPVKQYKYSDLGFYYLWKIVENTTHTALNEYVKQNFYDRLGAGTLGYLPLNRFDRSRIAPTEDDRIFRKQLIQGYVHDPGAAMMGGVAGHAGLFSDANDLAKIMQMYLNKGNYGGEKYFDPATIAYFTSCPFCKEKNRRGIGFDKPLIYSDNGPTCNCVSAESFGHTGFTGIMTWADPETGLLYVFLSNRVYPDASNEKLVELNVRTRIQEVLAKSLPVSTIQTGNHSGK